MKHLFSLLFVVATISSAAWAEENLCTEWVDNGTTCLIGAGREGTGWVRNCENDPLICKRHGRRPDPNVCKATTICVNDRFDPNTLETPCTDWQKGDSSYSCENPRASRWVRSCQWHNLETNVCSVDMPD